MAQKKYCQYWAHKTFENAEAYFARSFISIKIWRVKKQYDEHVRKITINWGQKKLLRI